MNTGMNVLPDVRLRFHIEHPALEDCYREGYVAGMEDIREEDNPYEVDSVEHAHWQEGWWAGFYGEEPLYALDGIDAHAEGAEAANEESFGGFGTGIAGTILKYTGEIVALAVLGYQVFELVA